MGYKLKLKAIYKILNTVNGKFYIGSTNHFLSRIQTHKSYLNLNKHPNALLQHAWNKYGKEKFQFIVLEEVEAEVDLVSREQYYLDTLNPPYNIVKIANSTLGYKHHPDTLLKISEAAKKPVIQYNLNLEVVQEWNSIREAATNLKISESHITECCKGNAITAGGFVFKYKYNFLPCKRKGTKNKRILVEKINELSLCC